MADSKSEDIPEVVESLPSLPTVTEQQRELGCQALREFENQQFGPCVSTLNKLLKERSSDVKVSQNKAVAEFYHSGLKNVEEFRKKMNCVCWVTLCKDVNKGIFQYLMAPTEYIVICSEICYFSMFSAS